MNLIFLSIMVFGNNAFPPVTWYKMLLKKDFETLQIVKGQIDQRDRSICPKFKSKSYSPCFGKYLKNHKIKTTAELTMLATLSVLVATHDGKSGYDKLTQNIFLLENLVILIEKFDPIDLHIFSFDIQTEEQAIEFLGLAKAEQETLVKTLDFLKKKVEERGKKSSRMLASAETSDPTFAWKKQKLEQLRKRWKKGFPLMLIRFQTLENKLKKRLQSKSK